MQFQHSKIITSILAGIMAAMLLIGCGSGAASSDTISNGAEEKVALSSLSKEAIEWVNPSVESSVRGWLNKWEGDISERDCAEIGILYVPFSSEGTGDISDLAHLKALEIIQLEGGNVSDISPLAKLPNLTQVSIESCPVSDISPLAGLENLEEVSFYNCKVKDVSALAGKETITKLNLSANELTDISGMTGLTGLRTFIFSDNQITDISVLAECTDMREMHFIGTPVTDITPVANMPELAMLDMSESQVSDLTPLRGLANLDTMLANETPVTDVSVLNELPSLRWAYLTGAEAANVEALTTFKEWTPGVYKKDESAAKTTVAESEAEQPEAEEGVDPDGVTFSRKLKLNGYEFLLRCDIDEFLAGTNSIVENAEDLEAYKEDASALQKVLNCYIEAEDGRKIRYEAIVMANDDDSIRLRELRFKDEAGYDFEGRNLVTCGFEFLDGYDMKETGMQDYAPKYLEVAHIEEEEKYTFMKLELHDDTIGNKWWQIEISGITLDDPKGDVCVNAVTVSSIKW